MTEHATPLSDDEWQEYQDTPTQVARRQWIDEKITQRVEAAWRERTGPLLDLIAEHERREKHNESVPLSQIGELLPEPTSAEYRASLDQPFQPACRYCGPCGPLPGCPTHGDPAILQQITNRG